MTQQYNRSLLAPVVILPTGQRQPYGQILDYDYNVTTGSKITINRVAGSAIAFTPNNPTAVLNQLDRIPSLTASSIIITDISFVWSSVSPANVIINTTNSFVVTGVGFDTTINFLKFQNGGGDFVGTSINLDSSTQITTAPFPLGQASTYEIYYTIDSGSTFIDTGLSVVVS